MGQLKSVPAIGTSLNGPRKMDQDLEEKEDIVGAVAADTTPFSSIAHTPPI